MWKKIETRAAVADINPGDIISNNPNSEDFYVIQVNDFGYVKAFKANGSFTLAVFPQEKLLKEEWWFKRE